MVRLAGLALVVLALFAGACGDPPDLSGLPTATPQSSVMEGPSATLPMSTPSVTASEPPVASDLADGRQFGYIKAMDASANTATFDLAYFYTGQAAQQAATEDGQPADSDYYIRNKNTKLRTVPYSTTATVQVVDWSNCCELHAMDLSAFVALFQPGGANEQYHGPNSQYWVTVTSGVITKIEEQYLP